MEQDKDIIYETGAVEKIGIVDEPLEKRGEDSLKIKKYSNALVTFIKNSLTPMTIGIQGSWGSGKTSLLNTIYAQLDDANEHEDSKDFKVIWINSWENSLMATPEEALIKIINEIINGLNEVDPSLTNVKKVKEAAKTNARRKGTPNSQPPKRAEQSFMEEKVAEQVERIQVLEHQAPAGGAGSQGACSYQ